MKNRVIWKMFLLTIVTLGIYRLYWFIKTRKEMMQTDPEIKILHPFFLFLPMILVIVSIVPMIISIFQAAANTPSYCSTYSSSYNIPAECDAGPAVWTMILFYLGILLIAPLIVVWLWGYAKGVEKITNGKMSFPVALLILYMVPDGIDILLVQDSFNKIIPTTTDQPPISPAPTT